MLPLRRLVASSLACLLIAATDGCSPPTVQEDRSINYSAQGTGVAFQHGEEGVYVASPDGQSLQRIFDSSDALAVSSPLWSPVDGRLIFATAHPAEPADAEVPSPTAWDADPEGREFRPQDVIFTCWLRQETTDGAPSEPAALFTARCDHPGYVAANLAVRWHPSGERIAFIDQVEGEGVSLFEFDLSTLTTRRLIEHSANALIFDWSPDLKHLTCSLLGLHGDRAGDGIWVRDADEAAWWRVPESDWQIPLKTVEMLQRLRESKPAWTADNQHFAFITIQQPENEAAVRSIFRASVASRSVTKVHRSEAVIRDLHWQPQTMRLAFVEGIRPGSLRMIDQAGEVSQGITQHDVRYFTGWNHDGSKLAYISPLSVPAEKSNWVLLFPAIPAARDRVYVADGATGAAAQLVHDDVRITFPQWSPTRDELSLWGTYAPTHSSWLSMVLPWTLRPGDPAAILDCATGELRWLAVNSHERSQVGHYYLLKRDYEQAWHWYEQAAKDRPPVEPIKLSDWVRLVQQRRIYQEPSFFEYICLSKLGRTAEAEQRLAQFRHSLTLHWDEPEPDFAWFDVSRPETKAALVELVDVLTPLIQSAYMAEVFLSLHAAEDGAAFFQQQSAAAATEAQRFASLVCQSQLLLASGAHQDYADLVTTELAPLLERLVDAHALREATTSGDPTAWPGLAKQWILAGGGGAALLPMASAQFTGTLPQRGARRCLAQWRAYRQRATDDEQRLACDLVIDALVQRLGADGRDLVRRRIDTNPLLATEGVQRIAGDVDQFIDELRAFSP